MKLFPLAIALALLSCGAEPRVELTADLGQPDGFGTLSVSGHVANVGDVPARVSVCYAEPGAERGEPCACTGQPLYSGALPAGQAERFAADVVAMPGGFADMCVSALE